MTEGFETRRVVAITGAGGALGAAVSRRLAGEPDTALVLSDVSEQSLAATLAGLQDRAAPTAAMLADVSEFAQVQGVVQEAVERFGRLDVLISNAGVLSPNGRIHNLLQRGLGAGLPGQRAGCGQRHPGGRGGDEAAALPGRSS